MTPLERAKNPVRVGLEGLGWKAAMEYVATFFYGHVNPDGSIKLMFDQNRTGWDAGELHEELRKHGMPVPGMAVGDIIAPKPEGGIL